MGEYYILQDGYVVSQGLCQDGLEYLQVQEGQELRLGPRPQDLLDSPPPPFANSTDIVDAVKSEDSVLNSKIQAHLVYNNIEMSVNEWRLENYQLLRKVDYPSYGDYLDASAKINSKDNLLAAIGWSELSEYYKKCSLVKTRFPKQEQDSIYNLDENTALIVFSTAAQDYLDKEAFLRGYGDPDGKNAILSLCSYASGSDSKFGIEGRIGLAWREAVWAKCFEILEEVKNVERTIPTLDEFLEELPKPQWPS